jgi:hypothetical protein
MEQIGKIIEKIKEWAQRLIDVLLGPESEPEPELIPIPVKDNPRRKY